MWFLSFKKSLIFSLVLKITKFLKKNVKFHVEKACSFFNEKFFTHVCELPFGIERVTSTWSVPVFEVGHFCKRKQTPRLFTVCLLVLPFCWILILNFLMILWTTWLSMCSHFLTCVLHSMGNNGHNKKESNMK